jgi:hypothetical protein
MQRYKAAWDEAYEMPGEKTVDLSSKTMTWDMTMMTSAKLRNHRRERFILIYHDFAPSAARSGSYIPVVMCLSAVPAC